MSTQVTGKWHGKPAVITPGKNGSVFFQYYQPHINKTIGKISAEDFIFTVQVIPFKYYQSYINGTLGRRYLCANYFTKYTTKAVIDDVYHMDLLQISYWYQPGDYYSIHIMEQISCTFCEIVGTWLAVYLSPRSDAQNENFSMVC